MTFSKKIKNGIECVSNYLDTPFFALFLLILEIFCYYFSLDLVAIIIVSFFLSFSFLFKKNLNCLLILFLFLATTISLKNSPANEFSLSNNFYYKTSSIIVCAIAAFIPISIAIGRMIYNFFLKKIKIDGMTLSVIFFGVALLTNGLLNEKYNYSNLVFGLSMFFFFVILFLAVYPCISLNKSNILAVSRQVAIYSILLFIENLILYLTFFIEKKPFYYRTDIFFGWGNENTIGMLFLITFCFLIYLLINEPNKKLKIFWWVLGIFNFVFTILLVSRQIYVFLLASLLIFLILGLIFSKKDKKKFFVFGLLALFFFIILVIIIFNFLGKLDVLFKELFEDERFALWKKSIDSFKKYPIFGAGFYFMGGDPTVRLESIMPFCSHNTIFELIGACGIIGISTYLIYRVFTIKRIAGNFSLYRLSAICGCVTIVSLSLLDIHIFDFFGSGIYVILLCQSMSLDRTEQCPTNEELVSPVKKC